MTTTPNRRPRRATAKRLAALTAIVGVLLLLFLPSAASGGGQWNEFERWDPATPSPTGQAVAVECNAPGSPGAETWPEAEARLRFTQRPARQHDYARTRWGQQRRPLFVERDHGRHAMPSGG